LIETTSPATESAIMDVTLFSDPVFQNFATRRPIATAAQLILRRLLEPKAIDQVFRDNAELQYERTLPFSLVTQTMATVVTGKHKSVNAAYRKMFEKVDVSVNSLYNKLQRIEPQISQAIVRHSYDQIVAINKQIGSVPRNDLPGYMTRILDGNHFAKTEHRLKETRDLAAGPLPGKSLVVFDPRQNAVCDYFPIEDGHAQERSAFDDVIETLKKKQLWIADRNFCTLKLMYAIAAASGCFIIRQHRNLHGTERGKLKRIGKSETAEVFENKLVLPAYEGEVMTVRRVVVKLFKPTRDKDTEIVILTNLPADDGDAVRVSDLYRDRWKIETAFMHMTLSLNCEVKTLCYPPAAVFCFALSLLAYNSLSVIKAMVNVTHGREQATMLSHYYLACELGETTDGLLIALPEARWSEVPEMPLEIYCDELLKISRSIKMKVYGKSVRGPKKPPPKKKGNKRTVHVSTKRLLEKRKEKAC
jgi:hypothetical protein